MAVPTRTSSDTNSSADINDLQTQINTLGGGPSEIRFYVSGNAYVDTGILKVLMGSDATIVKAWAYADTAPVGADLNIDVNVNGTTIFSSTFAIADGANSANSTSLSITSITEGDRVTLDIDQVGSSTAGADLMVTIELS